MTGMNSFSSSAYDEDKRKSSIKKNAHKKSFDKFLSNYNVAFSQPLDDVWEEFDIDKNGILDREEAKCFVDKIACVIQKDRAHNYDKSTFDDLFTQFDDDQNGYLTKMEMSQFIK